MRSGRGLIPDADATDATAGSRHMRHDTHATDATAGSRHMQLLSYSTKACDMNNSSHGGVLKQVSYSTIKHVSYSTKASDTQLKRVI